MKIGLINYVQTSIVDIAALTRTFKLVKEIDQDNPISFEICSYLPQKVQDSGIQIQPSIVGLPLSEFDILILPGSDNFDKEKNDARWISWIRSVGDNSKYYCFNEGKKIADFLKLKNTWKIDEVSPLNGFLVALHILSSILPKEKFRFLVENLGLLKNWDDFLQQQNPRQSIIFRDTAETQIKTKLVLDGSGKSILNTGIPFLDHMLSQIAKHGLFDLELTAQGDLEIDQHHTMEDCGISLGDAFRQALGDKKGINRMASATVPMDESLATVTIDFSGRPYTVIQSTWHGDLIGEIPVSLFEHFLESFATTARCNLFIQVHAGRDNHHICEAIFKALAKALDQACCLDSRRIGQIPSTKDKLF